MQNDLLRKKRCCFTGHRPEKLNADEALVCSRLASEIRTAVGDGYTEFISGMAKGVDLWAAEAVLALKAEGHPLRLICAVPFRGMEERWSPDWQARYRAVLANADEVHYICPAYRKDVYHVRNRWMVDRSARLIAAYTGAPGGTRYTVEYALQNGVAVRYILSRIH